MEQRTEQKDAALGGSLEQQAVSMLDGVIDQAVQMIIQRYPASEQHAEAAKLRIKEAAHRELTQLVADGQHV